MSTASLPSPPAPRRWFLGAVKAGSAVALALALAVATLRFLIPSRLDGAGGGAAGALAWVGGQYPLLTTTALFVAFSEAGRHWRRRLRRQAGDPEAARRPLSWPSLRRFVGGMALVMMGAFVVRSSIAASYTVVGPSMFPTLDVGDRILVNRLAYGLKLPFKSGGGRAPRRGDLVVFRAGGAAGPTLDVNQSIVKRVMGLPGDRIRFQEGIVFINEWPVPTCDAGPYVAMVDRLTVKARLTVEFLGNQAYLTLRKAVEEPFGGYTVKPGEVFVIGDNRSFSTDSRYWGEGRGAGVSLDAVEGRISRVLYGVRPDGRFDFTRFLGAPQGGLEVRLPGFDMRVTDKRINDCLMHRPPSANPPASAR